MYKVKKRFEVAASHKLNLGYESPCGNIHGHNWIITVYCKSATLNKEGMIVDFKKIKDIIHTQMDHKMLNDIFTFNPTAENIAEWIVNTVPYCYKAKVQESENNIAIFKK